jgi:hypothetical protein
MQQRLLLAQRKKSDRKHCYLIEHIVEQMDGFARYVISVVLLYYH